MANNVTIWSIDRKSSQLSLNNLSTIGGIIGTPQNHTHSSAHNDHQTMLNNINQTIVLFFL
jgi:hypothetical protein